MFFIQKSRPAGFFGLKDKNSFFEKLVVVTITLPSPQLFDCSIMGKRSRIAPGMTDRRTFVIFSIALQSDGTARDIKKEGSQGDPENTIVTGGQRCPPVRHEETGPSCE